MKVIGRSSSGSWIDYIVLTGRMERRYWYRYYGAPRVMRWPLPA